MSTHRPIRRLLVANRGEIARRIFRTCRERGVDTVAVFSDADAGMPFVREADIAIRIGPAASSESYLAIDRVIAAAKETGADAIHPGYGFLAENARFAEACAEAGLVFVGPSADAMRAMGLKRESKATVAAAGVPVVPGYDGPTDDAATVAAEAARIGYPVLVKASAGGGGKGMRVVREEAELADAVAGARREAAASFGDDTLILEKYVERPRHIEIQVFGDAAGDVIHLHERECSIQRRHQKIVEESPSVALDDALRARMGEAAVAAAKAIRYENAGTVEFILAPDGAFYFLEMNTRLQVEHPVTEAITGLDLVALQLDIAEGRPLPFSQADVPRRGAAIEVRLYAEDADGGFLPATGTLAAWIGRDAPGIRVDAGVEAGDTVSVHYDPMIAKVIASGADREEARRRLSAALRRMSLAGLTTNRDYLVRVLEHPAYVAGEIDTGFVARHADALAPAADTAHRERCAIAAVLFGVAQRRANAHLLRSLTPGFRTVFNAPTVVTLVDGDSVLDVAYRARGERFDVTVNDGEAHDARVIASDDHGVVVALDGRRERFWIAEHGDGDAPRLTVLSLDGEVQLQERPRFPRAEADVAPGACVAPMPGKVIAVHVREGDTVEAGAALIVLEAMKMEHTLRATESGAVAAVSVAVGDQVDADDLLARIDAD